MERHQMSLLAVEKLTRKKLMIAHVYPTTFDLLVIFIPLLFAGVIGLSFWRAYKGYREDQN